MRGVMRPREFLERGIREAEQAAAQGRINVLCVRALAGAAVLLGEADLADRAEVLLREAPNEAFFAGAIANFELPKTPPPAMRQPPTMAQMEEDHPRISDRELRGSVAKMAKRERHIALCLEGKLEEAKREAHSDLALEEVGLTSVVTGEFDFARQMICEAALPEFRQANVRMVLMLELYRAGRTDEAFDLLSEMDTAGLDGWTLLQLAIGFAGRIPWVGYPYPDW